MEAVNNYVLLKEISEDDMEKSSGGIFIQNASGTSVKRYTVISVTSDKEINKIGLKPDDIVAVNTGVVTHAILKGEKYVYTTIEKIILVER